MKGLAPVAPSDARWCASRWRAAARCVWLVLCWACSQYSWNPTEADTSWKKRWLVRVRGGGGLW